MILDLRRLTAIDSTGTSILHELKSELVRRKISLFLVVTEHSTVMARLEEFGALAVFDRAEIFPDIDRAIERAEDELLGAQAQENLAEISLPAIGLFVGFDSADVAAIAACMKRKTYAQGDIVFREGDPGDEALIVTEGTASAHLQLPTAPISGWPRLHPVRCSANRHSRSGTALSLGFRIWRTRPPCFEHCRLTPRWPKNRLPPRFASSPAIGSAS